MQRDVAAFFPSLSPATCWELRGRVAEPLCHPCLAGNPFGARSEFFGFFFNCPRGISKEGVRAKEPTLKQAACFLPHLHSSIWLSFYFSPWLLSVIRLFQRFSPQNQVFFLFDILKGRRKMLLLLRWFPASQGTERRPNTT